MPWKRPQVLGVDLNSSGSGFEDSGAQVVPISSALLRGIPAQKEGLGRAWAGPEGNRMDGRTRQAPRAAAAKAPTTPNNAKIMEQQAARIAELEQEVEQLRESDTPNLTLD